MKKTAGLLIIATTLAATAAGAAAPARIMSLNLCADVLLLQIAAPEQIASLTFLAGSSPLSPVKDQAKGIPVNHGSAEEVLALDPDLVLVHRYSNVQLVQALEKLDFKLWKVDAPATVEAAAKQIEALSAVLDRQERGQEIASALRNLPDFSHLPEAPVTAIYGPNGMTATPGALLHDLLVRAGLRNFAEIHALPGNGRIPLETLLEFPPDALVLSGESQTQRTTLAQQSLHHPALLHMAGDIPSTHIPGKFWSCGGLELTEAFNRLYALRQRLGTY